MTYHHRLAKRLAANSALVLGAVIAIASCTPSGADMVTAVPGPIASTFRGLSPTLTQLILTPATVTLAAGATRQFAVAGVWSDGSTTVPSATYTATGGTITPGGLYSAGTTPGIYRIIATQSGGARADTSVVTIPAPVTLSQLVLTPATATLAPGATQQFTVTAAWSDGSTAVPPVVYAQTGGTVTPGGLYTAGSASGTYRVVVTVSGGVRADTSLVTISPPSCPATGFLRLINVSTTGQLNSAVQGALPGDQIRMAPGKYGPGLSMTRTGTAANPITLCGPRTAILNGYLTPRPASHWLFTGFRITGDVWGVYQLGGSYNVYDGLEIDHVRQAGVALKGNSTHNIVRNNEIHHTGLVQPLYGECVYIGNGDGLADKSDSNTVANNSIHDCTAEGMDIKQGTTGNIIRYNVLLNTGTANIVGSRAGVTVRGDSALVLDNVLTTTSGFGAMVVPDVAGWGYGNIFRRNVFTVRSGLNGFQIKPGWESVTRIYCDNTVIGTTFGVSCMQ